MEHYLRFAFSFKGILTRSEFFLYYVCSSIISGIAVAVVYSILPDTGKNFLNDPSIALLILSIVFLISAAIRRLRDIGTSGWWILGLLVPYLNLVVLLSLVFKPGWNRFKGVRHLFAMLKILAETDGRVNQGEADVFARFCAENIPDEKIFLIAVDNFIRGASNPFFGFDHHLKKYLKKGQPSMSDRTFVMGLMVRLAEADGEINHQEGLLLEKVHNAFGLAEELPEGFNELIAMLAKLAKADGIVDQSEIEVIQNWFSHTMAFSKVQQKKAIQIFEASKNSSIRFEQHARNFFKLHERNHHLLENVMGLLTELALADNNVSKEESDMIDSAAVIFGFEEIDSESWKNSQQSVSDSFQDDELMHARILGIGKDAGMDEIKARYRKLITANHPDKVASMSDAIKNAAEIETKIINQAYEYFKAQYA
jgi:DnaJ like chaperone protein